MFARGITAEFAEIAEPDIFDIPGHRRPGSEGWPYSGTMSRLSYPLRSLRLVESGGTMRMLVRRYDEAVSREVARP